MYGVTLKHPMGDFTKLVELKGSAFSEANFPLPPLGVEKVLTSHVDKDGSGAVSLNDILTYTITATNLRTEDLTDVVVSDDLITPPMTSCPPVAPGETCTLVGSYVVTQADVDAGNIHNIGTADSNETSPVTDVEDVPVDQNPALGVVKVLTSNADADSSGTVSLNDILTYTITATNTGNVTLHNVVVSDDLTRDSISCPTVALLATCVLEVDYTVTKRDVRKGSIMNTGRAGSDQTPDVTADVVVAVLP